MRRPSRALPVGLIVAVLVGGCTQLGSPPGGGVVVHPGGTAVVTRLDWSGGFVPYEDLFTNLPPFTLVGDGRVIVQGPVAEVFPGPALPIVLVRSLTEEGIQSVIQRFIETGLFDESHSFTGASNVVADAPTTTFTFRADSREVIVDVYGLGILADPQSVPPEISEEEINAHQVLTSLEADLINLESWIPEDDWADPDWQPFEPTAFRLLVTDTTGEPPNPEDTTPEPVPWPGSTPPSEFEETGEGSQGVRCGLVKGDEAALWYDALSQADQLGRWAQGDRVYRVTPRPFLPDEVLDCAPTER